MNLSRMYRVRQRFSAEKLVDVAGTLRTELAGSGVAIKPGTRIAIAVGSRGIANHPLFVREIAAWVREHDAEPFIVPAMGSHGGATAEGQRKILESYGITGAPIISSMDVVQLGHDAFMDRAAYESDGVIVINRIKPHTSFHGPYESGLLKMIAIGLGKDAGARAIHRLGVAGLRELMPRVAQQIIATGKIVLGVAVVENAYDETMLVRAVPARQISEVEPGLLAIARRNMPYLPVEGIDVLVVDEIGKDISGTGMATNVIGRLRIVGESEPASPRIKQIVVRDLSAGSGGNGYGIGLADLTTRRCAEKIDWAVTSANVAASGFAERGNLPAVAETDEQALEWALPAGSRVVRIRNTLNLETLIVSETVLGEIEGRETIEVLGPVSSVFEAL